MNETIKNILERRAIRAYKPEQISPDLLDEILNAGLYAPSGMGMQSPITVAVQDKETISELSRMNAAVMGVMQIRFTALRRFWLYLQTRLVGHMSKTEAFA